MTLVSSKEFISNNGKYFDLALDEDVCIERGEYMFHIVARPVEKQYPPQPILEPDDDFRNAITAEELLEMLHEDIHQIFNEKK